jgi:putative peptidoglycan lipid II flippase
MLFIPYVYKLNYRYKWVLDFKDKHIKNMMHLALPLIIGVSVNQINVLVDRTIASKIIVGGISALNYANRLTDFILGIFVLSIVAVMFPMISKMASEQDFAGLKKTLTESINIISMLVIPATIGAMFFAEPIVKLLFDRGEFNAQAIILTSSALFFYSIGMIGVGLREVVSRAFYSLRDTKTPMINASISVALNIILNIILSRFLGIGGLAFATSISAIFCTLLLFISLRKKIGPFGMKNVTITFAKIFFASLVMGLIAKCTFSYLTANIFRQNLSLIIAIGIGAISYFGMIYSMKIEDVDVIVRTIKEKLGKGTINIIQ